MEELLTGISTVGFPIAVSVYLLYERARFNSKLIETQGKISATLGLIAERLK